MGAQAATIPEEWRRSGSCKRSRNSLMNSSCAQISGSSAAPVPHGPQDHQHEKERADDAAGVDDASPRRDASNPINKSQLAGFDVALCLARVNGFTWRRFLKSLDLFFTTADDPVKAIDFQHLRFRQPAFGQRSIDVKVLGHRVEL